MMPTTKTASDKKSPAKKPEVVNPVGLHAKVVEIMLSLDGLKPTGKNKHFTYKYWETDQLTGIFRSRFAKQGLTFMSDVVDFAIEEGKTAKGNHTWLTTVRVLYTITDAETGEHVSGHGIGQGDDPGDKGSNKAVAGALKYWLLKTFLMGGEDAEADTRTDNRYERQEERDPVVEDSDVKGVERGGRSTGATEVQVMRVRTMARGAGLDISQTIDTIKTVLPDAVLDIDASLETAGPMLVGYLEMMTGDDIGKLLQYLEKMQSEETDVGGSES